MVEPAWCLGQSVGRDVKQKDGKSDTHWSFIEYQAEAEGTEAHANTDTDTQPLSAR